MSVSVFPVVGEPMTNNQWESIFRYFYQGVSSGLVVSADGGGLRVFVSAGSGGVAGHGLVSTAVVTLPVSPGGATARVDKVVLDVSAPHIKIVSGGLNSGQYLVANVTVNAGSVTIAAGNVVNVSKTIAENFKAFLGVKWSDLVGVPSGFPASPHNHTASQITSGVLAITRVPSIPLGSKVSGVLPVNKGGTGGGTASAARLNLGLGSGALRNVTSGTAEPSGGNVGDIYLKRIS